jgi:hypothetical protein
MRDSKAASVRKAAGIDSSALSTDQSTLSKDSFPELASLT